MTVSVIIPAYNAQSTLERALKSIAAQTNTPLEIIVVDDGSTDNTWSLLTSFNQTYQTIPLHIARQDNAGAGAARNCGIAMAKGAYLAFLDADDTWHPEKLEKSIKALEEGRHAFVCHNLLRVDEEGVEHLVDGAATFKRVDALSKGDPVVNLFFRGYLAVSTMVIRTDIMRQAGGFDAKHRYALDYEFWLSLFARWPKTSFNVLPDPLLTYYPALGGLTSKALPRIQEREVYLQRYGRAIAKRSPWPAWMILGWSWLSAIHDAWHMAWATKQIGVLCWLLIRTPWAWGKTILIGAYGKKYQRPDFLESF